MTTPLTPSPMPVQLTNGDYPAPLSEKLYHVLPHLAVRDEPAVWQDVVKLLLRRGLTYTETLERIRFAYTGNPNGQLPPGIE